MGRIVDLQEMIAIRSELRHHGQRVVFTNGVFDLLHRGHVEYLQKAAALGDVLVVGINTDASVRNLKGESRPLVPLEDRAFILAALECVDYVVPFAEDTPEKVIRALLPEVLVKGADYKIEEIVGHDIVSAAGGRVERIAISPGRATTNLIETILERYRKTR
jgi:D-beta-D-heptose 7-phosphate kinase/D-beta-D-heptose 1-phosphate adenosyltransferase